MSSNLDIENSNTEQLIDNKSRICMDSDDVQLKNSSSSERIALENPENSQMENENTSQIPAVKTSDDQSSDSESLSRENTTRIENIDDNSCARNDGETVNTMDLTTNSIDNDEQNLEKLEAAEKCIANKQNDDDRSTSACSAESGDHEGVASSDSASTPSCMTTNSESPSISLDTTTPSDTPTPSDTCDTQNDSTSESCTHAAPSSLETVAVIPPHTDNIVFPAAIAGAVPDCIPSGAGAAAAGPSDLDNSPAVSDPEPSCSRSTQSTYHIKWIKFREDLVPIITQNDNGPCPLIAIMNVLLLQGKVKLPSMIEMITSSQLMDYLGDCILEYAPKNISEDAMLNYEQNMHDAMAVFHKLQTGLDVNVRFTGVSTFEYTSECIVFDLLEIPLHHGWLVDPENAIEVSAVGNCSYNQLVEKIIAQKNSPDENKVTEALVAEDFLNRTCHQLTYHGLSELATQIKDQELSVFFRNNHFSTLYKKKDELFLLVTDQGFLTESNVVWETLSNVEGDGHFVDAVFRTYRKAEPSTKVIAPSCVPAGSEQQIDQDYLVALSLQEDVPQQPCSSTEWKKPAMTDLELAMKLQEEENRRGAAADQRQQGHVTGASQSTPSLPQTRQPPPRGSPKDTTKKSNSDCVIL